MSRASRQSEIFIAALTVLAVGLYVCAFLYSPGVSGTGLELPPDSTVMAIPDTLTPVEAVVERLKAAEGLRLTPYDDSLGNSTICYGTKLPLTAAERAYIGVDRDLADGLTEPECDWLLRGRVQPNADDFIGRWPPYAEQPYAVQVELVDAAYQLGGAGLASFHDMLGFLQAGDYESAAQDVLRTLWGRQTPARAETAAAAFRSVDGG